MSSTESELRQDIGVYCSMYATAREKNDVDKMRRCIDAIEALLSAQKQRWEAEAIVEELNFLDTCPAGLIYVGIGDRIEHYSGILTAALDGEIEETK